MCTRSPLSYGTTLVLCGLLLFLCIPSIPHPSLAAVSLFNLCAAQQRKEGGRRRNETRVVNIIILKGNCDSIKIWDWTWIPSTFSVRYSPSSSASGSTSSSSDWRRDQFQVNSSPDGVHPQPRHREPDGQRTFRGWEGSGLFIQQQQPQFEMMCLRFWYLFVSLPIPSSCIAHRLISGETELSVWR